MAKGMEYNHPMSLSELCTICIYELWKYLLKMLCLACNGGVRVGTQVASWSSYYDKIRLPKDVAISEGGLQSENWAIDPLHFQPLHRWKQGQLLLHRDADQAGNRALAAYR